MTTTKMQNRSVYVDIFGKIGLMYKVTGIQITDNLYFGIILLHTTMAVQTAKYEIVTEYLRKKIREGQLKPGDKVPSENALTNKFGLSRDTVRRGFKVLEESGILERRRGSGTYVSDKKTGGSNRIAVVTTYVENYIFPKIIMGIGAELSKRGYSMQLSFTQNRVEKEKEVLSDILLKGDVAGIIMEPVKSALPNPNLNLYKGLKDKGIPIVFINSFYKELDVPHVSLDDEKMAYMATKYLISHGHRKIGAILKMDDGQGHLRFSGFRSALAEIDEENGADFVAWYDTKDEQANTIFGEHLDKRLKDCSAVFCYNDKLAREYIDYLKEKGVRVPEDVSVIGLDNSEIAELGDVKITTFPHPMEELGRTATENLLSLILDPRFDATKEFVTQVKERDSVKSIQV